MGRGLRWLPALLGLALLGVGALRPGALSTDPDAIFLGLTGPALLALVASALLLLPAKGRLALASFLVPIAVAEGGYSLAAALRAPEVAVSAEPDYYRRDGDLGYAPKAGVTSRVRKRVDGRAVYDVEYRFDAEGRRVVPVEAPGGRRRFLLCFGGSSMFGEGLEGSETLPARLATHAPRHRPYNYAFRGYGPQHLLAELESGGLRSEIPEPRGSLVYLFIDAHVLRAIGSLVVHAGWAHDTPYYGPGPEGRPRRKGTLTTGRPWTALLFSVLGQSHALSGLGIDLPPVGTEEVEWTARLLGRSAELFHRRFEGGRFVVAVYPGSRHAGALGRALEPFDVEVLDYSGLFDPAAPGLAIPHDGHPTARANRILARRLAADLGLAPGGVRGLREGRPAARGGGAPREP